MAKQSLERRVAALREVAADLYDYEDLATQFSGLADTIMCEVELMEAALHRSHKRKQKRTDAPKTKTKTKPRRFRAR